MKLIAIQASGRKTGNTALLLEKTLENAKLKGYETELIHLTDINFKGCRSCFACKLNQEPWISSYKCAVQDSLTPVLEKIHEADILLVGAPIYFGSLSADTYAFLERLFFPANIYNHPRSSLWGKKTPTGYILTMNNTSPDDYKPMLENIFRFHNRIIGPVEYVLTVDTYQFDDYTKYYAPIFNIEHKKKQKELLLTEELDKIIKMLNNLENLI